MVCRSSLYATQTAANAATHPMFTSSRIHSPRLFAHRYPSGFGSRLLGKADSARADTTRIPNNATIRVRSSLFPGIPARECSAVDPACNKTRYRERLRTAVTRRSTSGLVRLIQVRVATCFAFHRRNAITAARAVKPSSDSMVSPRVKSI